MLSLELVQKLSFCPPSVSPNGEAGEALAEESLSVTLIKYRFFIPLRSIQNDKRKVFGQPLCPRRIKKSAASFRM